MKEPILQNSPAAPLAPAPIEEATQNQRIAADPHLSSWVAASAGSGKTKVLTDRILRLLLPRENGAPGTRPEKILALTFTKAAASEMALRLSSRLSHWAIASDDDLVADMRDNLLGRGPNRAEIAAARTLFARVIDTPGGINIMTIHAFCLSVLGRFPVEAGIPSNFKELDDDQAAHLLQKSLEEILSCASTNDPHPVRDAIIRLSVLMPESTLKTLLRDAMGERYMLQKILQRTFGVQGLYTALCTSLGVRPAQTPTEAIEDFCMSVDERMADLRRVCTVLQNSTAKTSVQRGLSLQQFLDAPIPDRALRYNAYRGLFLTNEGGVRAKLATSDVIAALPDAEGVLDAEAHHILALTDHLKAIACTQASRDFFLLAEALIDRYQKFKAAQGALDFDDQILTTLSLIKGETDSLVKLKDVSGWVLFKLDGGLDHILVDEAQDTNPEQWEIIEILAREFFHGEGAREDNRTLFVVGDEKQSIFGFQRAAPEKFGDMFKFFQKKIQESGQKFAPVEMSVSFRSTQTILDCVDQVFIQSHDGHGLIDGYRPHRAKRMGQAGIVEVWPVLSTDKPDKSKDVSSEWEIPETAMEIKSGSLKMAKKIGDSIQNWVNSKVILESYDRPIEAGDILVLVRSRKAFVAQLVRELKTRGIPVSGVDRMVLRDQIGVQDLCVAAAFALLPDDDLTLACLLKSPLVGLSEDDLYALSYGRPSSLWQSLKVCETHKTISHWLEGLIADANFKRPYEFFEGVLQSPCPGSTGGGLCALRTRLGEDSLDPIDEFLNSSLNFEHSRHGGMQAFLKWHTSSAADIKRQMEEAGKAVRIMTIHAAKGLQAPIVFMPDTLRQTKSTSKAMVYWPHKTGFDWPLMVLSPSALPQKLIPAKEAIDKKEEEENRRLLYVAMTRAEERLYIGGHFASRGPSDKQPTWYKDIQAGLSKHPAISEVVNKEGVEPTLRLSTLRTAPPDKKGVGTTTEKADTTAQESWVRAMAPPEPLAPKTIRPSQGGFDLAEDFAPSPIKQGLGARYKRGQITHKALQFLPQLEEAHREGALKTYLAQPSHMVAKDVQTSIFDEVMSILNHPVFAPLFGPMSRAEVPVTGLMDNGEALVSGQIDRLVVTETEVLIVDYKTNRPPPTDIKDVPHAYRRQMEIYKKTLSQIYPDKSIRTALLWTDGARLMEIV